ncbi:hypothetical protein FJO69_00290 [[Mycoplasma] falconis]|uniref:Mycoplasma lipoprotein central domain-containing protein n=1 Tax=[Mycoplasma] falconis TaxID=92403 RepID=A0A501XCF5_9BACT|nr:P80 family lipoprotein [[Mycoplasma] falconis]TPE58037.1 hypothetical protein FJO69_00290 [[Mycoplasma] falconis]
MKISYWGFATLALPLFTIACQEEVKKEITWLVPYEKNRNEFLIYNHLANEYNQNNKNQFKVNVIPANNRSMLYNQISLGLSSKDKELPNLLLYYPSLVKQIYKYDQILKLDKSIIKEASINENLLINNQSVLGIKDKDNIYTLPLSLSVDSLAINKNILGKVLFSINKAIKENDLKDFYYLDDKKDISIFKDSLQHYLNNKKDDNYYQIDLNYLKTLNKSWSNELFKTNEGLIKISQDIAKLVNKQIKDNNQSIYFINHPTNFIYSLMFQKANNNYSNYFLKVDYKTSNIDYKNVFNEKTIYNKNFNWIYNLIANGLENNWIDFYDRNDYYSNQSDNKLFALISSHFWYLDINKKLNKDGFIFLNAPFYLDKHQLENKNGSYLSQGQNIIAIKKNNIQDQITNDFIKWIYKYKIDDLNNKLGYISPVNINKHGSNLKDINKKLYYEIYYKNLVNFAEPVDSQSDKLRNTIQDIIIKYVYREYKKDYNLKSKQYIVDRILQLID